MANSASHAALPWPVKGARYTIAVPYLDAGGVPTDPTTPDTEVSIDGATYADCTEEVTTVTGSNGSGYITLTGAETNCSLLFVAAKVASGPKTTLAILQPRVLPILESGTAQAGAAGTITLASGAAAYDLTGAIVKTTGGTGGGGTGGANNQARIITAYNTSTKVATVVPNWETTPSSDTTYDILLTDLAHNVVITRGLRPATDGRLLVVDAAGLADANTVKVGPSGSGTAQTARDVGASVLLSTGTGTGQLDFTAGVVKCNAVQWLGGTIPAVNVTGVPLVDMKYVLGTLSPGAPGYVALDWGQITNKTTTNALTGTSLTLTSGERTSIADAILGRNIAGGSSSGRIVTDALRALRNKQEISGGTYTVYQEDDTTSAWTAAVTTAAGNPLSSLDPA